MEPRDPATSPLPDDLIGHFDELSRRYQGLFEQVSGPVQPIWDLDGEIRAATVRGGTFDREGLLDSCARALGEAVERAQPYLPLSYQEPYVRPLLKNFRHVVRASDNLKEMHNNAEALAGAIAQHLPESSVRYPLRQFLAVVANLYRSFLAPDKRASAGLPQPKQPLPPLVMFHHQVGSLLSQSNPPYGPAVLTAPMTRLLCGADIAVVALPSTYCRHPLSWVALAHEASGHGVIQADPKLLSDLIAGIRTLFGGGPLPPGQVPNDNQAMGLLWSYWAEETASDVYGLLNVGPAYALHLAALFAAIRMTAANASAPLLAVASGRDPEADLDVHPTDILRIHVAIGVIENFTYLSRSTIDAYTTALRKIADHCAQGAWETASGELKGKVWVRGRVEIGRHRWVPLDLKPTSYTDAAEAARRVGAYIAAARLGALHNRTIQDVETWDDSDEQFARSIARRLLDYPKVRWIEAGQEKQVSITEALRQELDYTDEQIAAVIRKIRNDQFDAIDDNERSALRIEGLTPELTKALQEHRIEELRSHPDLVRAIDLDRIDAMGDDGQLLAGATVASLWDPSPEYYRWINRWLAHALLRSYRHDAIMGDAESHRMFDLGGVSDRMTFVTLPPQETAQDALEKAEGTGVAARSAPR